ncbi:MAG: (Fe-S)-binding protein [Syntrophaceae bacterium]|nr:(Fe-S)-binding protein [Syntrophaceae bacterium]
MFDPVKCDFCGECLGRCAYIDFDREEGGRQFEKLVKGEPVDWLRKCITCFACNEFCPRDARPFDLILQRMEALGDYVDPNLFAAIKGKFAAPEGFSPPKVKSPILSVCTIEPIAPWAFKGSLFDGLDVLKGRFWFCNVLFPHLGNETVMIEGVKPLLDRYAALGVDEVIFAHDDCYALMADWVPRLGLTLPFKATHLFEFLARSLKARRAEIRPLGMKVAYQRPCASRGTPGKEAYLDEIFALIGVERVARKYDREEALCCGQAMKGFMQRGEKYPGYQTLNIEDAKAHGASAMAFLCPMCLDALKKTCREAGLEMYMVSDLCRLALGEDLQREAPKAG